MAGGFVVAVAVIVIAGWLTGVHALVVLLLPRGAPMVMNSALCALVCGAGVLALASGRTRAAAWCGAAAAGFAAVVSLQFFLGRSLGVDELFWHHQWVSPQALPGRMAPNTAAATVLVGLALVLCAAGRARHWLLPVMGGVVVAFALLPLLSYVTTHLIGGEPAVYRGMAPPTVACLLVLAAAILWRVRAGAAERAAPVQLMAAALGMLIAIGVVTVQSNADLVDANRWVVHSYEVRGDVDHFVEQVARLESAARAFALTTGENFRTRTAFHRAEALHRLEELQPLVADNPAQSARVARLRALAEEKFEQNGRLIDVRVAGGAAAAAEYLASLQGDATRALVALADELRAEENRLLDARERALRVVERNTHAIQIFGGLIALGLLGAAIVAARRATSARRTAEEEQRASEVRFRSAFEDAGIGMALVGLDGRWLRVNRAICSIVGYAEAELLQKTFQDITHPDDLAADLGHVRRLLAGERDHYAMEKRYFHRDGHTVWINLTVSIVRDAARQPVYFISQIEDITLRKQAEQALAKSEQMFQRLFEGSPDAVVLIDRVGRIVRANARAEALFDWPVSGLAGQPLDVLLPGRLRAHHGAHMAEFFRNPRARPMGAGLELFGRRRDGSEFPVDIMLNAVETDDGVQALAVVRDITNRRRLETELRSARDEALTASRLKSEFLATVSHEIRTPMNGILGMADLLKETKTDAEQRDMVRIIQSSAEGLLTIINDILDFSKMEAGKLRLEPQEFEWRGLIEETLAIVGPRAQEKRLSLAREIGFSDRFLGDAGRIRQVLTNLAGNAIKFTQQGGVTVRAQIVRDDGAHAAVRVSVEDTGIGIAADAQARLFQPFMQADGSATRRFGGTGLGLAISRQLVTLMGGEIGFTSEPGRGSTFWFELSLTRTNAPAPEAASPPAEPARPVAAAGQRLLIVDDNVANQIVARLILEKMGYAVTIAEHGQRALDLLGRERYAAVLMDCQMPVLDGYEATRRIRAGDVPGADPRVPIIALTAYAMADDRAKCIAAGMDDYVSKPVREVELQAAFQRCRLLGAPPATPAAAPASAMLSLPAPEVLEARVVAMVSALPGREGPSLWPETVALFTREEPRRLAELGQFAATRSGEELAAAAHTLASSCATLGGGQMRAAALALERAARAGDWLGVETRLRELQTASARLRVALKKTEVAPA